MKKRLFLTVMLVSVLAEVQNRIGDAYVINGDYDRVIAAISEAISLILITKMHRL